jgi:hypothetical protein
VPSSITLSFPLEGKPYLVVMGKAASAMKYCKSPSPAPAWMKGRHAHEDTRLPPMVTGRPPTRAANFANWFTYFRRREYVAKNALATLLPQRRGRHYINKRIISRSAGERDSGHFHHGQHSFYWTSSTLPVNGGTPLNKGFT